MVVKQLNWNLKEEFGRQLWDVETPQFCATIMTWGDGRFFLYKHRPFTQLVSLFESFESARSAAEESYLSVTNA